MPRTLIPSLLLAPLLFALPARADETVVLRVPHERQTGEAVRVTERDQGKHTKLGGDDSGVDGALQVYRETVSEQKGPALVVSRVYEVAEVPGSPPIAAEGQQAQLTLLPEGRSELSLSPAFPPALKVALEIDRARYHKGYLPLGVPAELVPEGKIAVGSTWELDPKVLATWLRLSAPSGSKKARAKLVSVKPVFGIPVATITLEAELTVPDVVVGRQRFTTPTDVSVKAKLTLPANGELGPASVDVAAKLSAKVEVEGKPLKLKVELKRANTLEVLARGAPASQPGN